MHQVTEVKISISSTLINCCWGCWGRGLWHDIVSLCDMWDARCLTVISCIERIHFTSEWCERDGGTRQQVGPLMSTQLDLTQLTLNTTQLWLGHIQLTRQRPLSTLTAWQTRTQTRCTTTQLYLPTKHFQTYKTVTEGVKESMSQHPNGPCWPKSVRHF